MTLPSNFPVNFFAKETSTEPPVITRNGMTIVIPCFVTQETVIHDDCETTQYAFYPVAVPYNGQDYEDEEKCRLQCYASLRKYFYGTPDMQNEMRDDGTWDDYRKAIRIEFPNPYKPYAPIVIPADAQETIDTLITLIIALAVKYDAMKELSEMNPINIENLLKLMDDKGVSAEDRKQLTDSIVYIKTDIEGKMSYTWYRVWADAVKPAIENAVREKLMGSEE